MSQTLVRHNGALQDPMTIGKVLAASGFFQDARQEAQAVAKVLAGQELGIPPVAAMTGVNIIKGRVTLSANLIAALVKRSGKYNYRVEHLPEGCRVTFTENGEEIGVSEFTAEDARKAGLTGDNWRKYPRNMYFARAISNGAKWYTPDIFGGPIYTPDELGAEIDGETGEAVVDSLPGGDAGAAATPQVEAAAAPSGEVLISEERQKELRKLFDSSSMDAKQLKLALLSVGVEATSVNHGLSQLTDELAGYLEKELRTVNA